MIVVFSLLFEFNLDVLDIVVNFDWERRVGKVCGLMYGILFIVKENIGIKDKMEIMVGFWVFLGF